MSKYNSKSVVIDGIKFQSQLEAKFYEYLKTQQAEGKIQSFSLQPKYILQDKFKKNGVSYREIAYFADFEVIEIDGIVKVYDVKAIETETFKVKKKLFEFKYKNLHLLCVTYSKKWGNRWLELSELNKLRKEAKKQKELA